jgi:hypothetical protein
MVFFPQISFLTFFLSFRAMSCISALRYRFFSDSIRKPVGGGCGDPEMRITAGRGGHGNFGEGFNDGCLIGWQKLLIQDLFIDRQDINTCINLYLYSYMHKLNPAKYEEACTSKSTGTEYYRA